MLKTVNNLDARWPASTVVCIASGPSLQMSDVEVVRQLHVEKRCHVIVVNREFKSAPWADICYMADYNCWKHYYPSFKEMFKGEGWTVDKQAAKQFKLNYIVRAFGEGYSTAPNTLNTGGNSGYQAIHLAAYLGASRIILLGYDMQRTGGKEHHYGRHEGKLPNGSAFEKWLGYLKPLIIHLHKYGLEVINASRVTAIPSKWIPRKPLEEIAW